eukprot:TRINITY_DN37331_c0_g2_i1.p1 TRINITY_DN37331_c0_g2~~TRINITY_DN37331_c0_g2_i1.p1  ORF type:complete len:516 (+),score=110.33 TRINITY_DN37331_c0_g2_i1:48-1550(+)
MDCSLEAAIQALRRRQAIWEGRKDDEEEEKEEPSCRSNQRRRPPGRLRSLSSPLNSRGSLGGPLSRSLSSGSLRTSLSKPPSRAGSKSMWVPVHENKKLQERLLTPFHRKGGLSRACSKDTEYSSSRGMSLSPPGSPSSPSRSKALSEPDSPGKHKANRRKREAAGNKGSRSSMAELLQMNFAPEELSRPFEPSDEAAAVFWGMHSIEQLPQQSSQEKLNDRKGRRSTVTQDRKKAAEKAAADKESEELAAESNKQLLQKAQRESLATRQRQPPSGASGIVALSKELHIPPHTLKDAINIFEKFATFPEDGGDDDIFNVKLDMAHFEAVLLHMCSVDDISKLSEEFVKSCFTATDKNKTGDIDVKEFAAWYATFAFSEDMMLNDESKYLRQLARQHNLSPVEVEQYKRSFDAFDLDGSGTIEFDEFEELLHQLLKVPAGQVIPRDRVQTLWRTACKQGTTIAFSQFCLFYMNYFGKYAGANWDPFSDFYRNVRRVGTAWA